MQPDTEHNGTEYGEFTPPQNSQSFIKRLRGACVRYAERAVTFARRRPRTAVVALTAVIVLPFLAAYAYYLFSTRQDTYYEAVAKSCAVSGDYGCCIASARGMEQNGYRLAESGSCGAGERTNSLSCTGSLQWCEPIASSHASPFKKGDAVTLHGTIVENVAQAGTLNDSSYLRIKTAAGDIYPVFYRLSECRNTEAIRSSYLNAGLDIEVKGTALSESDVSICGSDADYVRVASPGVGHWDEYTNDDFGVGLKIPQSWEAYTADGRLWIGPASRRNGGVGSIPLSIRKLPIESAVFLRDLESNPKQKIQTKRIVWNGLSALRFGWKDSLGITEDVILAEYGTFTYAIMFDEKDPVHEAILETIIFYSSETPSGL